MKRIGILAIVAGMMLLTLLVPVTMAEDMGWVQGTVTDADSGDPISGAMVTIVDTGVTAITDSSGMYNASNVPVGTYDVEITHHDYDTKTKTGVTVSNATGTTVDETLTMAIGYVEGTITDADDSEPLENAEVVIDGPNATATTGSDGTFNISVTVGTYDVVIVASNYQQTTKSVTVTKGMTADLSASLTAGQGWLEGEVTEGILSDVPVVGATVKVEGTTITATTDSDGTFNITLKAGTYNINITAPDFDVYVKEGVTVSMGETKSLNVWMEKATGTVVGTVTDKNTGDPLYMASVDYDPEAILGGTFTEKDGTYSLELEVGEWELVASALVGYENATQTVTVVAGQEVTANFELEPTGEVVTGEGRMLTGTIKDMSGNPIEGATVKVGDKETTTDEDGKFFIDGLEEKEYDVKITKSGYDTYTDTVNLATGSKDLTLKVPTESEARGGLTPLGWIVLVVIPVIIIVIVVVVVVMRKKKKAAAEQQQSEQTPVEQQSTDAPVAPTAQDYESLYGAPPPQQQPGYGGQPPQQQPGYGGQLPQQQPGYGGQPFQQQPGYGGQPPR